MVSFLVEIDVETITLRQYLKLCFPAQIGSKVRLTSIILALKQGFWVEKKMKLSVHFQNQQKFLLSFYTMQWCTMNQTKSLSNLICAPLVSINHVAQTWQIMPTPHKSLLLFFMGSSAISAIKSFWAENWCPSKRSINNLGNCASTLWEVVHFGSALWAVSCDWNWYIQMSCVPSCWKPYQNTSGRCNTFTLATALQGLIVSFTLPMAHVACLSSCKTNEQGYCQLCLSYVSYLPGSSLASSAVLPSSMSKSVSRTVFWPWFRGTEDRQTERERETHTGFDKGLTKELYLFTVSVNCTGLLYGFVSLLYKGFFTRMNKCQGLLPACKELRTFRKSELMIKAIRKKACENTRSQMWVIKRKGVTVHLMQRLGKCCCCTQLWDHAHAHRSQPGPK